MKALLYARVSTEKQADKELSIPAQLDAMREYARTRAWTISEEFIEPGASARTTERPTLRRLLARCRQEPKVDVVIVHKVDRLARDVYGHAMIKALLKQRGIRLASVVENVDDSITGQLVENIMASIAEFYSANLGEEVKKGMRVMIHRGQWPHQPPRGYRLIRNEDKRPVAIPDEEEATAISEAFRLYRTGRFSIREISEELLIRGLSTASGKPLPFSYVRKMLENPFYCGRLRWNGAEYPGNHSAIVPEAQFREVQDVLRRRYKQPGERGRLRFLLRGLATCAECGHLMTAEHRKRWSYYRCVEHTHSRCRSRPSSAADAHMALMRIYRALTLSPQWRQVIRSDAQAECDRRGARGRQARDALRRRRDRLLARELKLTQAFTAGDLSSNTYRVLGARLRSDIAAADQAVREPQPSTPDVMTKIDRLLEIASSLADVHQVLDLPKQQILLSIVFDKLALNGGHIVDYTLKPPFDALLSRPTAHPPEESPPGATADRSEQRAPTSASKSKLGLRSEQRALSSAIESLLGFDFDRLDDVLDEKNEPTSNSCDVISARL